MIKMLCELIRANNPNVLEVEVGGSWIGGNDLAMISSALEANAVVKKLSLEWAIITSGFDSLVEMIAKNECIEELDLRYCSIRSREFERLAHAIADHNTTLKRLDVRGNYLDDESAVYRACEALATSRTFELVHIGVCRHSANRLKSIRAARCEEFKRTAYAMAHGFYDKDSDLYPLYPGVVSNILSYIKPRPFEIRVE